MSASSASIRRCPTPAWRRPSFPLQGSHDSAFKENLLFGKIDVDLSDNQRLELTARVRREKDHIPEDFNKSAPGNDQNRINNETRLDLKHEWTNDKFLNEARVGYERYEWSPNGDNKGPEIKYFISTSNVTSGAAEVISIGGSPDAQDKIQKGILLQNDLTYTGMAGHTLKVGAKVKFMSYDLSGAIRGVDVFQKLLDKTTGNPVMFGANDYFQLDKATTPTTLGYKNQQFGLYVQDDWEATQEARAQSRRALRLREQHAGQQLRHAGRPDSGAEPARAGRRDAASRPVSAASRSLRARPTPSRSPRAA